MEVRHEPTVDDGVDDDGGASASIVLATDVEVADTFLQKLKGLMFRGEIPADFALVFDFDRAARRSVHMLFVRAPLDVVWLEGDRVSKVATLSPWTGLSYGRGDRIIEFPAGAAADVTAGDRVVVHGHDV